LRSQQISYPASTPDSNNEGLFLIQDPFGLGQTILPIWDLIDKDTLQGLGTSFRIDNLGAMLTAYHVLEHTLEFCDNVGTLPVPKDGANPLILEIGGMALGRAPILPKNWLSIRKHWTKVKSQFDPYIDLLPKNLLEIIFLDVPSRIFPPNAHKYLKCTNHRVKNGEKLLAVGYADMSVEEPTQLETACTISGYMYGSFRKVVDFREADLESSRPWPVYIMDGDWPSGMSGGPVFDDSGDVVGLVSTGSPLGGYATARAFHGDEILFTS
jgi:serine protease Do